MKKVQALKLDLIVNCASALRRPDPFGLKGLGLSPASTAIIPPVLALRRDFGRSMKERNDQLYNPASRNGARKKLLFWERELRQRSNCLGLPEQICQEKYFLLKRTCQSNCRHRRVADAPPNFPCPGKLSSMPTLLEQFAYLLRPAPRSLRRL